MRTIAMFSMALSLAVGSALMADTPSAAPQAPGKWGAHSRVGKLYNPAKVEEGSGTVISFQQTRPRLSRWHAVVVFVKTPQDDNLELHLGPQWFLEENSINLQPNDAISYTGSKVIVEGRPIFVAKEISIGDKTLVLRKDDGKPVWTSKAPSERFSIKQNQ